MKKIVLSLFSLAVLATTANAQLAIAPELGLNMANLTGKSGGTTSNISMKAGVAVGAVIDLGITQNIYFQPGLFYEMTGCKFTDAPKGSYNLNTITIPLNFEYKTGKEGSNRFFAGVGPYVGYNVSGKAKFDGSGTSGSSTMDLKIGSTKLDLATGAGDDIKALDLGFGVNVGYLLTNGFFARAHYQMGLANLDPNGDSNNSLKSSAIGVTVGYYFNTHKGHMGGGHKKK